MKITALFSCGVAIGLLSATLLAGCQKESNINRDITNTSNPPPGSGVGLAPVYFGWGALQNDIPYVNPPVAELPSSQFSQGFTINGLGFVCGGELTAEYYGRDLYGYFVTDLWQYDAGTKGWIKRAPFPGGGDHSQVELAINFVIGDNAYIIGTDNQTYKYNQPSDAWSLAAPFPGVARGGPCGFAVNGQGYVGMGATSGGVTLSDWWQYDPIGDKWYKMYDFPGNSRWAAACFTVGGKGYIVGGAHVTAAGSALGSTVWQYTPGGLAVNGSWQQMKNFSGGARYQANGATGTVGGVDVGFVLGGIASGFAVEGDAWEYYPPGDSWAKLPNIAGGPEANAGVFVVGKSLFVCRGNVDVMGWSR